MIAYFFKRLCNYVIGKGINWDPFQWRNAGLSGHTKFVYFRRISRLHIPVYWRQYDQDPRRVTKKRLSSVFLKEKKKKKVRELLEGIDKKMYWGHAGGTVCQGSLKLRNKSATAAFNMPLQRWLNLCITY